MSKKTTCIIIATAFSPSCLTIEAGDTVCFVNASSDCHTVTDDLPGTVCSGDILPGKSYERTFTSAGKFPFHCKVMPSMKGEIIVTECKPVS